MKDAFGDKNYSVVDLGGGRRKVVFAIPVEKLYVSCCGPATEVVLNRFLSEHFKAFTATTVSHFTCWLGDRKEIEYNGCRLYEASYATLAHITLLTRELARIALATGLDCVYLKAGEDACLIRPIQPSRALTERVV